MLINKHFGSRQILCGLVKYITWLQYFDGIQHLFQLLKYIVVCQKIPYLAGSSLHI